MSNHKDRVVIRRKKMAHAEHHGGSWKIAYADFMTAMMAFFLVMWILSLVPKQDLKEIADYFRMPLMDAVSGGHQSDYSRSVIPGGQPSLVPNPHPGVSNNQAADDRQDVERLEDLKSALEELIRIDPVLKEFRPQRRPPRGDLVATTLGLAGNPAWRCIGCPTQTGGTSPPSQCRQRSASSGARAGL